MWANALDTLASALHPLVERIRIAMKIVMLVVSLALVASLGNMDVHLIGIVEMLPLLLINAAGGITIAWAWAEAD
jgi:hypothetical protein